MTGSGIPPAWQVASSRLQEDFEDFFATTRTGLVIADPDGRIDRVNPRFAYWLGYDADEIQGGRFSEYLTIAGKVYFETHLRPLLRMQGFFDEVALELACKGGERLYILLNGIERRDEADQPLFTRLTVTKAADRRRYEKDLLDARREAVAANAELRALNSNLGQQIADEMKERLTAEGILSRERETSALREQFIAVLGHDLRNPLASISGGARLLQKTPLNERGVMLARMIDGSVARMAELIDNVMDFARGRLGGGLNLTRTATELQPVLRHIVDELRLAWPHRTIEAVFEIAIPVHCDPGRLSQLLSNLIANALTHGAEDGPIRVRAVIEDDMLELSVANGGKPIPAAAIERLFQPFTRDEVRPSQQGLGLGLYIVSEIARAHDGTISVTSTEQETAFTFQMPIT